MIRRLLRLTALAGLAAGVAYAIAKLRDPGGAPLTPRPTTPATTPSPAPPVRSAPAASPTVAPPATPTAEASAPAPAGSTPSWVAPEGTDVPDGHPVKVKTSSGIYHLPGSAHYERTKADRCYADAAAAEADGFRPAKR